MRPCARCAAEATTSAGAASDVTSFRTCSPLIGPSVAVPRPSSEAGFLNVLARLLSCVVEIANGAVRTRATRLTAQPNTQTQRRPPLAAAWTSTKMCRTNVPRPSRSSGHRAWFSCPPPALRHRETAPSSFSTRLWWQRPSRSTTSFSSRECCHVAALALRRRSLQCAGSTSRGAARAAAAKQGSSQSHGQGAQAAAA